jgi:hypothetical protein
MKALRSAPNRVDMWVSRGDPMRNHRDLLRMHEKLYHLLASLGIEYWTEYGSVLGPMRHKGMIPWEWDMDIGLETSQFEKLVEFAKSYDDPDYGFRYYRDPDYESEAFSFYPKFNEDCLCDIAEYKRVGDELVCAVEDWHYPPHNVSDILPPRKVAVLGCQAMLPANPERFLKKSEVILGQCTGDADPAKHGRNEVPWQEPDPIPFLLCHMFHPGFAEKAYGPPVVDIPEATTLREGFDKYARAGLPFVVRSVNAFDLDVDAFTTRMRNEGLTVDTWDKKTLQAVKGVSVAGALDDWAAGKLAVNITDSSIPKLVRNEGIIPDLRDVGIDEDRLMLILTMAGTYTPFHQDPFGESDESGGGWMWLSKGRKLWNFLPFEYTDAILHEEKYIIDMPNADLVYANNHALWGKVGQVIAEAGDFVYFPPGCNHRVWTYEDSIGVGGYLKLPYPEEVERVARGCEWFRAHGLDPAADLFQPISRVKKAASMT